MRTIKQVRNSEVGGSLHWKWRGTFERGWEDRIVRPFQVGESWNDWDNGGITNWQGT